MTAARRSGSDSVPRTYRRQTAGRARRRGRTWRGVAGVVGLIIVIEVVSRSGIVPQQFLPPFSTILARSVGIFGRPDFQADLLSTIWVWFVGLAIAVVLGVVVGVIFGLSDIAYRAFRSVVELVRPVPPVALIPLFVVVLGNGVATKLVVVVFAAIWPILFNAMYGVHDVDPLSKDMAASFGKSRSAILWRVVIPSAGPLIATGVRISSSIVLVVVITVELIAGGASGLGAFIASAQATGVNNEDVFAGVLVSGILGVVINLLLSAGENRWFGWNKTSKA